MQKIWIFLNSWLHPVSIILKKVLGVLFPLGWDLMDSGMTNVQMQVERWTVSRRVKILVDFEVVGIRLKSKLCNQLNVKSSLATCVKLCAKAYGQWQSKVWNTFFFCAEHNNCENVKSDNVQKCCNIRKDCSMKIFPFKFGPGGLFNNNNRRSSKRGVWKLGNNSRNVNVYSVPISGVQDVNNLGWLRLTLNDLDWP